MEKQERCAFCISFSSVKFSNFLIRKRGEEKHIIYGKIIFWFYFIFIVAKNTERDDEEEEERKSIKFYDSFARGYFWLSRRDLLMCLNSMPLMVLILSFWSFLASPLGRCARFHSSSSFGHVANSIPAVNRDNWSLHALPSLFLCLSIYQALLWVESGESHCVCVIV